ncbi:MAG: hypothetical protein AAB562_00490 [Patescibacteria group bacterium]
MLIVTHAAMGALIGQWTPYPWLGFVLGFLSHLFLDMIPHGDAKLYHHYKNGEKTRQAVSYVLVDAVGALLLTITVFDGHNFASTRAMSFALAGSILPDFLVGLAEIVRSHWLKRFVSFHFFFHNYIINRFKDFSFSSGIVFQLIVLGLFLLGVY